MPVVTATVLEAALRTIYEAKGVPPQEAAIVASHQTASNLAGHDSHGAIRTATYVKRIERGDIVPGAQFEVEQETATTAVINGNWGFGFVQTERALELATAKAKSTGVAAITIRYQGHMGRLGAYMETATASGLIGLMTADSGRGPKAVAPYGGRVARLGTNPISFGVPTSGAPLILDMATSAVAGGKVQLAKSLGEQLDEGLLIDSSGHLTTDPNAYYTGGALLPMGGKQAYKGFGLSVIVEILCGILTGLGFGVSADARHNDGNFIALFDIARFRDLSAFIADVDAFIAYLKDTPLADGFESIYYPGELEAITTQRRLRSGISIEGDTWDELGQLLADAGRSPMQTTAPEGGHGP